MEKEKDMDRIESMGKGQRRTDYLVMVYSFSALAFVPTTKACPIQYSRAYIAVQYRTYLVH